MFAKLSGRFLGFFQIGPGIALLTVLASGGARLVQAQDVSFLPAVSLPLGGSPESIALGDFNGDGLLDLAVANGVLNNVSILLGNQDGTFQDPVNYPVGTYPQFVTAADLNGDGVLDLVVSNRDSGDITVLLGTGDGTFEVAETIRLSESPDSHPFSVAVGDFNGDGFQDLAVTDLSTTFLLFGNGDGSFSEPVALDMKDTGPNTWFVAVGDFNGDGIQDLAVTNYPGDTITILLGNGDGTLQGVGSFSVH